MDQHEIIASAQVPGWQNVFVLGTFDSRITFFSQQVRGFNLAFALSKDDHLKSDATIAIVGAGAAGISTAAGIALLLPQAKIKIFDRAQSILHLQRGCTPRNLHPHIYDWPNKSAFRKDAGLPYLNWSENSAATVATSVTEQFEILLRRYQERVTLNLSTTITAIEIGVDKPYLLRSQKNDHSSAENHHADVVVLAVGFGQERELDGPNTISYWSPQGMPDDPRGTKDAIRYVVSGSGDGALVDLLAAVLDNFDHTALIKRVTGAPCMEKIEDELGAIDLLAAVDSEPFDFLAAYKQRLAPLPECIELINELASRVRIQGHVTFVTKRAECLEQPTSTLNRFMVFLVLQAASQAGRPINHVIGELKPADDRSGALIAGLQIIEGDRFTIRHGNDKESVFSAFEEIRQAYMPSHKQWLQENIQRTQPPKLALDAESALFDVVQAEGLLNLMEGQSTARPDNGWHPLGSWSYADELASTTYLFDDSPLLHIGTAKEAHPVSALEAINYMRVELSIPRAIVRMIGHSGVGKTRLAQAVFDDRIGDSSIPEGRVYYADNVTEPSLSPIKLATMLVESHQSCVMIVDNCSAEVHAQLARMVKKSASKFSLFTIDYNAQDDLPAHTAMVKVEGASNSVITSLLQRRHASLDQAARLRLAHLSAGNAQVALSLAELSDDNALLSNLSDNELFRRLLHQTNPCNQELEIVAGACALLYSFNGEPSAIDSDLGRLANLTGLELDRVYRHINTLIRRKLLLKRGPMRGLRLHAMANSLAVRALDDIHPNTIKAQLETNAPERLISSFARRLSYLDDSEKADHIVKQWLAPEGRLGDLSKLDYWKLDQFNCIAPRAPAHVLAAIQRLATNPSDEAMANLSQYSGLIGRLAYDAKYFPQCIELLARIAVSNPNSVALREITKFCSVIVPASGATISERLNFVTRMVDYQDACSKLIARAILAAALKVTEIGFYSYSNTGFQPPAAPESVQIPSEEISNWFCTVLRLLNDYLSKSDDTFLDDRNLLLGCLNTFGTFAPSLMSDACQSILAASRSEFWYDAWKICDSIVEAERLDDSSVQTVRALRDQLSPRDLEHKVLAVLQGGSSPFSRGDLNKFVEEQRSYAILLGRTLASRPAELLKLWQQLSQGTHSAAQIGAGLAMERAPWESIVAGWTSLTDRRIGIPVLNGYLKQLVEIDNALARSILDDCLQQPLLLAILPTLQVAAGLDLDGVARLERAFATGAVPDQEYASLHAATFVAPSIVLKLLPLLAQALKSRAGFVTAVEMASRWVGWYEFSNDTPEGPALHALCRTIVSMAVDFEHIDSLDYEIAQIVDYAVANENDATFAKTLASRWRAAAEVDRVSVRQNPLYKGTLLRSQPVAVLDGLFEGTLEERLVGEQLLLDHFLNGTAPMDMIPANVLAQWCLQGEPNRFEFAAHAITLLKSSDEGAVEFSDPALLLLRPVSTRSEVLRIYCDRLYYNNETKLASIITALDLLPSELVAGIHLELQAAREMLRARLKEYWSRSSENARWRENFE